MSDAIHPPQIERLLELVSPRVGLVRQLQRVMRGADEPVPPVLYSALLSNYDFRSAPALERGSAGKGLTDSEAIGGAIGEAVERYCAAHVDPSRLHRTALGDAPAGAVLPQDLVLYSEAQYTRPGFAYLRPAPELQVDWVRAVDLPAGEPTWVPAVAVYMHGNTVMPGDALFPPTSNGLAAGPNLMAAVRSGLCELIERDAFLVMWMNRLPAARLVVDAGEGALAGIIGHYARFGVELQLYDLSSDIGIPVVMALALAQDPSEPAAVVGLGCHPDPRQAALRASFEIAQVRPGQTRRAAHDQALTAADVRHIEHHAAYFAQHETRPALDFLVQSPARRRLADMPGRVGADAQADVDACVAALRRIGSRVLYVELTTPDLADFPIHVVRTLATGVQPIHFGHGMARLGSSRLFDAARRLAPDRPAATEADLNDCPHPLA